MEASLASVLLKDLKRVKLLPPGFMCAYPKKEDHMQTPALLPTFMLPRACMGIVFRFFLEYQGDAPNLAAATGKLNGVQGAVRTVETRKGTAKEVQTISTFGGADGYVNASTKFFLKFRGQTTGVIEASPNTTDACDATAREVQQVQTTTVDTFEIGRAHV